MKTCIPCGTDAPEDDLTCGSCGEASWNAPAEPAEAAVGEPASVADAPAADAGSPAEPAEAAMLEDSTSAQPDDPTPAPAEKTPRKQRR